MVNTALLDFLAAHDNDRPPRLESLQTVRAGVLEVATGPADGDPVLLHRSPTTSTAMWRSSPCWPTPACE